MEGVDDGIWRRLMPIPFDAQFLGDKRDTRILERLTSERGRAALMSWAVEGCLRWKERGELLLPSVVQQAVEAYRSNEDKLGSFISERCTQGGSVRLADFVKRLNSWADEDFQSRNVSKYLRERGYEKYPSNGTCFRGISLAK